MTYVSLNQHPSYYAFSHTWIPRKRNSRKIIVDGTEVHITENLYDFLKNVAAHQWPGNTFTFWLDTICINQTDTTERNHQVSMMRDIYKCALATISWMGPYDADIQHLFRGIKAARARADSEYYSDYDYFGADSRKLWNGFRKILARPYWSRVWILQEVALAKEVHLLCGDETVTWSEMDRFVGVVQTWEKQRNERLPGFDIWLSLDELRKMGPTTKIWLLLEMFSQAGCEDPRDHVYGLLPMAEQTARDEIIVDYDLNTLQVFMSLSRYCRKVQPSLTPGHDLETTLGTLATKMGIRKDGTPLLLVMPSRAQRLWRWTTRRALRRRRWNSTDSTPVSMSGTQTPLYKISSSAASSTRKLDQLDPPHASTDVFGVQSSSYAVTSRVKKSTISRAPSSFELRKPLFIQLWSSLRYGRASNTSDSTRVLFGLSAGSLMRSSTLTSTSGSSSRLAVVGTTRVDTVRQIMTFYDNLAYTYGRRASLP